MEKKLSYCRDLVRKHDPDRFLLSLFAPFDRREALWTLFAFNYEIAKTREVVSETQLGQFRLQWWRDALAAIYDEGRVLEHEVVEPLAAAIAAYDLPREELDSLIYAREFDLEDTPPAHVEGLLIYADHTTTPLLKLALRICGDDPQGEVIEPIAINYALAGLIRAVPYYAAQGRDMMPADLKEHSVPEIVKILMDEVVMGLKPENRMLKATNHFAILHLNHIKRCDYDPYSPRFLRPPALLALRLALQL